MNDYNFVIELEFSNRMNALLVPFANVMCIRFTKFKCMGGHALKMFSIMQLNKKVQKRELTFFASSKEEGLSREGNVL